MIASSAEKMRWLALGAGLRTSPDSDRKSPSRKGAGSGDPRTAGQQPDLLGNGPVVKIDDSSPLSAVIVNHEDGPLVLAQLKAYYLGAPDLFRETEWTVIHNGPEELPALEDDDPCVTRALAKVRVHVCKNQGYGTAINTALEWSDRPFLLALNADLMPEPGFLTGLYELLAEWPAGERLGIIGTALRNLDGSAQGSWGKFPTLLRMMTGLLRPRATRKYRSIGSSRIADVPWVTGACFLLSRECLDEIGPLDELFFLYYEDVDLCQRARNAGWRVRYDPRVAAKHFHPYHSRQLTLWLVYQSRRALLRYFWKHRPRVEFRVLGRIMRTECRLRGLGSGWETIDQMVGRVLLDPEREWARPVGEVEDLVMKKPTDL